uniref:Uncharacterized protein n=1 Tax=viral metagenome TaxID=1070528 RepID=A0A6C0JDU4_9ZZZZ
MAEEITIYKSKNFDNIKTKQYPVVIAFDLDETLGSFCDLEILWKILVPYHKNKPIDFNKIMDLYPEFLRYGILSILEFIYLKKKQGLCNNVYIYTNNQCFPEWSRMIASYFDYKLKTTSELFDKIICAFKINNKIIEFGRTTHQKTFNDFINCTMLPRKTKICFIDNSYFYEMNNNRVYYIQPLSYVHHLSYPTIIDRFMSSDICAGIMDKNNQYVLYDLLHLQFSKHGNPKPLPTSKLYEIDIYVSQKLMYHIKEFFYLTQKKNRTKKIRFNIGKFTRKRK